MRDVSCPPAALRRPKRPDTSPDVGNPKSFTKSPPRKRAQFSPAIDDTRQTWTRDGEISYRETDPLPAAPCVPADEPHTSPGAREPSGHYQERASETRAIFADPRRDDAAPPLATYARAWLVRCAARVRPTTHKVYTYGIEQHLVPALGARPLDQITRRDVRALVDQLRQRLAPKTTRTVVATLSVMLTAAVEDELVPGNVTLRLRLPQTTVHQAPAFTADEMARFLAALRVLAPHYAPLFQLCGHAGLRIGEARAIRKGDADFATRALRIERTAHRGSVVGPPKDGPRVVRLPPHLAATLEAHEAPIETIGAYDFPNYKGHPLSDTHAARLMHAACDEAGLARRGSHALRRSFVSQMLAEGAPLDWVRRMAGHASAQITQAYNAELPMADPEAFLRVGLPTATPADAAEPPGPSDTPATALAVPAAPRMHRVRAASVETAALRFVEVLLARAGADVDPAAVARQAWAMARAFDAERMRG